MILSNSDALPVTIVTGFLGSGKTTLLNRLLRRPELADTAVIVNEFGEVGIDHLLIEQAIENTVLLKNGCICCTVRGDVADTLDTLWRQRDEGAIPHFSRVVIETTGLADPGPVAHAIAEPGARYRCRLDGIVTTVDAMHGASTLARHEEARRQAALADRIFITKTDLAPDTAALEAAIDRLNPRAPRRRIADGNADPADIFDLGPQSDPHDWLRGHHHDHDHGHAHDDGIGTVLLSHDGPIPWPHLATWLDSILSLRGEQVLRLKGIVALEGEPAPLVLQAVHHVVHPLAPLPSRPDGPLRTEIVLITDGLSPRGLAASFADALA